MKQDFGTTDQIWGGEFFSGFHETDLAHIGDKDDPFEADEHKAEEASRTFAGFVICDTCGSEEYISPSQFGTTAVLLGGRTICYHCNENRKEVLRQTDHEEPAEGITPAYQIVNFL